MSAGGAAGLSLSPGTWVPAHIAAAAGHVKCLQALARAGEDWKGALSPLERATKCAREEAAAFIMEELCEMEAREVAACASSAASAKPKRI